MRDCTRTGTHMLLRLPDDKQKIFSGKAFTVWFSPGERALYVVCDDYHAGMIEMPVAELTGLVRKRSRRNPE